MRRNNSSSNQNQVSPVAIIAGAAALLFIVGIYSSVKIIQPGNVGVVIRLGAAQENALGEGVHFVVPFITQVQNINIRIQRAQVETEAASQDLQVINAAIVVNYRVDRAHAVELFRELGMLYLVQVLEPAIQEAFKADAAKYTAEELITKRAEVSEGIQKSIRSRFEQFNVLVEAVNITSFEFSPEFNKAIEEKVIEEQAVQRAENELRRIMVEAEQEEARAKGEAAAILAKAQAEAEALELKKPLAVMELIWLTAVEKWDGKLPTHLFGAPPVPVFEAGVRSQESGVRIQELGVRSPQ